MLPNQLPYQKQNQHILSDGEKTYKKNPGASDRMVDNISELALDFSSNSYDAYQNYKRESTEALEHGKAAKIANVGSVNELNVQNSNDVLNGIYFLSLYIFF